MPDAYRSKDRTHEERLTQLIHGVTDEIQNRKVLQRIKASLRSFRHTHRTTAADAGFYLTERSTGVVLTVVAVPAVVAATVASAGVLPVGLVLTAAVAWGVEKGFAKLRHSRDVSEILEALRKFEANPLTGGPDMRIEALPDTLDLARNMVEKLISDTEKLTKEIEKTLKASSGSVTQATRSQMIRWVLQEGKKAAGSGGVTERLQILPVHTKSKVAAKYGPLSLLHLRLQRIRTYIAWLYQLVENLKQHTLTEVEAARKIEPDLMEWISVQVHAVGNHHACHTKFCFGPGPADMQDVPIQAGDPLFRQATDIARGYASTALASVAAFRSEYQKVSIADERSYTLSDNLIDTAAEQGEAPIEDLAEELGAKIGSLTLGAAGVVAGKLLGELGADALGTLVELSKQSYRVNRPLMSRVRALQDAMRKNGPVSLDKDIAKLAGENDLNAILRALTKATYHYPKRIAERGAKLSALHQKLKLRAASPLFQRQSRLATCNEAAMALRYLYKVYHNAEKQMIHLHFVGLGLDALSRQVFDVSASLAAAPKSPVTPSMLVSAIAGLKSTTPHARPDPGAFEKALQQQKASLKATTPQVADPIAQMRAAWAPLGQVDLAVAGKTYISRAVQPPKHQPVETLLTDKEWKDMSSIWGLRSDLTKTLDTALRAYRDAYQRNRLPQAAQGPVKPDQLQPLLAKLKQRRGDLRVTLEKAIAYWLQAKNDKAVSKRRWAVEQLQAMVALEARALDQAIGTLSGVSSQATILGMALVIEAEDD